MSDFSGHKEFKILGGQLIPEKDAVLNLDSAQNVSWIDIRHITTRFKSGVD
jgi:hypothetical protein